MNFENNVFVITGSIPGMTRNEAIKEIMERGGVVSAAVTKKTTVLIVGKLKQEDSNKIKKAKDYQLKGFSIEIISADEFLKNMEKVQLSFNI